MGDLEIISLQEAKENGLKFYYTGKVCKYGHLDKRYTLSRKCKTCTHNTKDKRWQINPDKERARSRDYQRRKYVTTRPCPELCELCGERATKRSLHLDHDHKTGKFRGWLCHYCNTNLGRFGDSVEGLQKAIKYLSTATELTAAQRKTYPVGTGMLDYFPKASMEISHVSYVGNEQHNPGQPLHWDRSKSQDEADALMRHFLQRGTIDTDGLRHSAKLAWRALALLEKELEAEK